MLVDAALVAAAYVLGAVPFGLLVGLLWRRTDIRKLGSGNIGAANIYRNLGAAPGATVFILDTAKGAGPVILSASAGRTDWVVVACGFAAIAGHMFSPFLSFRGGKGVATSLGVTIAVSPAVALICLGIWATLLAAFRYVSLASILAVGAVPIVMAASGTDPARLTFGIILAVGVLLKHIPNIGRLAKRTEPRVSFSGQPTGAGTQTHKTAGAT